MNEQIQRGTVVMHRDTRAILGPVTRQSMYFYFYRREPTSTDCRKGAKVRKDLAMVVQAE